MLLKAMLKKCRFHCQNMTYRAWRNVCFETIFLLPILFTTSQLYPYKLQSQPFCLILPNKSENIRT